MKTRYLKVREGRRDYCLKDKPHKSNPTTPFLLLKGTWLEEAGSTINTSVSITVDKNCLLIAPNENT